jgi:hypothetical protein
VAPVFPEGVTVPMDDVDKIPYMCRFAKEVPMTETLQWLEQTWIA